MSRKASLLHSRYSGAGALFCLCCHWYSWKRKFCVLKVPRWHSKWTCVLNFQWALFWPVSEFSLKYPSIQAAYAKQSSHWDTSEYGCVCPLCSLKMCSCIPSGDPRLAGGALFPTAGRGHVGRALAEEMQVPWDEHSHCIWAAWLLWTGEILKRLHHHACVWKHLNE